MSDPAPGRWLRYAERHLAAGHLRSAYNAWMSHVPSLGYMLKFAPPPARVLVVGCGHGLFDVLLAGHGYAVTSLDSDRQVLDVALATARRLGVELQVRVGDAFDLGDHHDGYDVAFSAGLVEHWNGRHTTRLIAEHARCAPLVQIEVPTRHTLALGGPQELLEDTHLFGPREFVARVRQAGLRPAKVYPTGGVPGRTREMLESLIPPLLFRRIQLRTGYSMGLGCLAFRT